MKNLLSKHGFKAVLIILFISLAFIQWKKEKVQTKANDITLHQLSDK